ncbi:MAG: hypothetical protein ABWZ26_03140 [Candidatus Nanopelagicales bacterium]
MCTKYDTISTRFARDVVRLNTGLAFRGLPDALPDAELLHRVERPGGLTTLAVRTDQLPDRYLLGLMGFRLAQYLQLGYACEQVVHATGMFAEPAHHLEDDDVHVVTLDAQGRILGYLCLAGSGDSRPLELTDPARRPFPVEVAHDLNLFDRVPPHEGVRSNHVRELKRFVHSRLMHDKEQRLQVTMELLLGAGRALLLLDPPIRTLVGDVEEDVALRHIVLAGMEVVVIEGTTPALPYDDVMHPLYTARDAVKPFVAHVPDHAELQRRVEFLNTALAQSDIFATADAMPTAMPGSARHLAA